MPSLATCRNESSEACVSVIIVVRVDGFPTGQTIDGMNVSQGSSSCVKLPVESGGKNIKLCECKVN